MKNDPNPPILNDFFLKISLIALISLIYIMF